MMGVCGLLLASPARAVPQERGRILVMVDAEHERIGRLLEGEISSIGLFPIVASASAGTSQTAADLEQEARKAGAVAAVRADGASGALELWIADRVTGRFALHEVVVRGDAAAAEDVAVLRVVELLRASFIEVPAPPPPRVPVAPAPEVVRAPAAEPAKNRLSLGAGMTAVGSPGGAGMIPGALAQVAWRPSAKLELELWAALPFSAAQVSAIQGNATLAPRLFGLGAARTWHIGRLGFSAGVDAALLWMHVASSGDASWIGQSDDHLTGVALARTGASLALSRRWRLTFDARGGAALQKTVVRFNGVEAAHWGRPLGMLSLGVEAGLW